MENEKRRKKRVRTTSIITLLVCIIDIYIIINIPEDYTIFAAAMFIALISAVVTLNNWFKWKDLEDQRRNEQYSDIMNVQKSSYVILQKKVQDLDEKLNFIGQKIMPLEKAGDVNQKKIASMLDSIVEDQKKIAKITISRSKENADALMNSNDKLLLQMEEFRNSISSMQEELLSRQGKIRDEESEKLDKSTDEIFKKITELKDFLEQEADEISENILTSNQFLKESYSNAIEAASESKNTELKRETETEELQLKNIQGTAGQTEESSVLPEEQAAVENQIEKSSVLEQIAIENQVSAMEKPTISEPVAIPEQVTAEELAPVPEPVAVPEQVTAEELAPVPESVAVPEQVTAEELAPVPEPVAVSEQVTAEELTPVPEPVVVAGKPVESKAADSSKPESSGTMSPEDIAALIAKTKAENLPETTEKYEEEEKPPMPDMSDPNRPMSPEDIAALIANM